MRNPSARYASHLALAILLASYTSIYVASTPAYAYNCPSGGSTSSQKDTFSNPASGYDVHGWLGYCQQSVVFFQFYGGQDSRWTWGGSWHNVSYISVHMRVWVCGHLNYDQTQTYNNAAYDQLVSQQFNLYGCFPQADVSGYETVYGSWSWSWYLNY